MQYINGDKLGNEKIGRFVDKTLNLVFPLSPYCLVCDAIIPLDNEYGLCSACMKKFSWGHIEIAPENRIKEIQDECYFDSAVSCVTYGMNEKKLITRLKYGGKTYYARAIGKIMADRILSDDMMAKIYFAADYAIPVPIHSVKLRERGFNQCDLVSKYFRHEMPASFKFTVENDALIRVKETPPMKNITRSERYANLEGAFKVNEEADLKGKTIILIDDVYTTGSTANHCAKALKEAGAVKVHFFSYATT